MDDEFIYPLNRHLTPYWESQDKDTVKLYHGNCIDVLKKMSGNSVQCCITSPPYWGLRDYGTGEWNGGDENCDHLREIQPRNNRPLGKFHSGSDEGNYAREKVYNTICGKCGAIRIDEQIGSERTVDEYVTNIVKVFREVKRVLTNDGTLWLNLGDSYDITGNLAGVPWRVAFALQQDGWILRQDIIWHKPNPMPESVQNRCTKAHEYIFILTKSMDYYYDNESIKRELKGKPHNPGNKQRNGGERCQPFDNSSKWQNPNRTWGAEDGGNKHSVWTVTSQPYPEGHFATFPQKLIEPCILAGSRENDIILDPFMGAATTAITAIGHKRRTWGIELNEEYIALQIKRIEDCTRMNTNVWKYMNRHFLTKGK